jgi:perosamine synthetase
LIRNIFNYEKRSQIYLIPRLNFYSSLRDLGISFIGIFRSHLKNREISKLFKNDDIFLTNHARTGLRLLLNSFNLPPNAKIGVQILNCHTVFTAIIKAGYKPIFIDIDDDLTLSVEDLKKKLNQIDALIVTHIFGIPARINEIKDIMKNKPIIEDCAHSFLSTYKGELTGTFSDASIFSFGKGKFPSIGRGGFVVINNKMILHSFKEYYFKLEENKFIDEIINIIESLILSILHNRYVYKLVNILNIKKISNKYHLTRDFDTAEKRVLKSNLSLFLYNFNKYESDKKKQGENVILLKEYLKKYDYLNFVHIDNKSMPNYIMLPVITTDKIKLISTFYKMGIEIGPHFLKSIEWAEKLGYKKDDCCNAEKIIAKLVVLPTYKLIIQTA